MTEDYFSVVGPKDARYAVHRNFYVQECPTCLVIHETERIRDEYCEACR